MARHGARLEDGRTIDAALVRATLAGGPKVAGGMFAVGASLFAQSAKEIAYDANPDFLTLPAYPHVQTLLGTSPSR